MKRTGKGTLVAPQPTSFPTQNLYKPGTAFRSICPHSLKADSAHCQGRSRVSRVPAPNAPVISATAPTTTNKATKEVKTARRLIDESLEFFLRALRPEAEHQA